ncbi:hypothetical protein FACS1894191_0310 [Clostridia bacterium]|nr:hypothetical protein FACS1894191_0310 [Clostridia bacterium]
MSVITTHDTTLYGGNDEYGIVLRPLCDEHLPLLYKWSADPEVTYWTEGGTNETNIIYGPDTVHKIYGGVSKDSFCFLIEADGTPIGECRLQRMNLPEVKAMYAEALDVRRIDMSIGEKAYWNKGIGSLFVGMLIDFAFNGESVDVLHCFCEDYNVRSRRVWEKNGFTRILAESLTPQPQKGKWQYHYRLTCQDWVRPRRENIPPEKVFELPLDALQPSQLYISAGKLRLAREWFEAIGNSAIDPIPIKDMDGKNVMTDGHTRAVMAKLAGCEAVPVYWETAALDWNAYRLNVKWCEEEAVTNVMALAKRIVPHRDYERLWRKRCAESR